MAEGFQCIGIIGKYGTPNLGEMLQTLADYLTSRQLDILLDEAAAEYWCNHGLTIASREALGQQCNVVIVVGGDGTFLNAARSLAPYDAALIGINQGHLGFLTDISPDEMVQRLDEILSGNYIEESRFLLHSSVLRDGEQINENVALNDVVVNKWNVARMLETETFVNGQFLNHLRSDGLIVSTPTGSTAYALSGGGPILQPSSNAMVLVPICPHTMSNRPIVIHSDCAVDVVIHGSGQVQAQVTYDGQINFSLNTGDRVRIKKYEHKIRLIHPPEHDHFHLLRTKLGWG